MTNHIFIIDDDPELTELLQEFLESHNYHITIFNNPEKGVESLLRTKQVNCDLVILDIMMPGIDGFQILRKIRESSDVPVIMLLSLIHI